MEERNQRDKEVQEKKALVEQRVEMNKRLEMRERIQKQQQQQDHRLRPQRSGLRAEPEVDQAQRSQGRELPAADTSGAQVASTDPAVREWRETDEGKKPGDEVWGFGRLRDTGTVLEGYRKSFLASWVGAVPADVGEDDQKIQLFIHAFNQIKEASGVNDPNEIIQKFLTQDDTQKNLTQLTKDRRDNHALIEKLQDERRRLRSQVEELKFSNGGGGGRRQAIDDFESHLGEATEKCERNRGKYERLARMLIDVKAGISHLAELLVPIKLEGEAPLPLEMTDETVEEVLQESEKKISKLLSLTAKFEDISEHQRQMDEERYEEKLMMRSQSEAYGLYFVPLLLLSRKTSSQKRVDLRGYRGVFLGLEGGGEAETRCFWSDGGASEHTQTLHVWHISAQKDSRYLLYAS
ncbi:outer dynein arm-docking complex subunit 3 (Coiled-coil domain-containing protein 151) [Durusdinium trenchii]|uniref:Outer dynein arm-docking complex subunit 3 (Coiled-coil domain-containing protein 151) n=1 Tax=Durusdinium trenchii TaxID=1381693 RepID=A0ABP0KP17_9DINO